MLSASLPPGWSSPGHIASMRRSSTRTAASSTPCGGARSPGQQSRPSRRAAPGRRRPGTQEHPGPRPGQGRPVRGRDHPPAPEYAGPPARTSLIPNITSVLVKNRGCGTATRRHGQSTPSHRASLSERSAFLLLSTFRTQTVALVLRRPITARRLSPMCAGGGVCAQDGPDVAAGRVHLAGPARSRAPAGSHLRPPACVR